MTCIITFNLSMEFQTTFETLIYKGFTKHLFFQSLFFKILWNIQMWFLANGAKTPLPLQNLQIPLAHLCSILRSFDHDEKGRLTKIVLRYRLQSMCRCLIKVMGFYYKCVVILSATLIWKFERRETYEENMYLSSLDLCWNVQPDTHIYK